MVSGTRNQLLAEIATLYYKEKKTQRQIAGKFGYSRSAISRLLSEAEKEGIVAITIKYPLRRDAEMERRLQKEYNLEAAVVFHAGQSSDAHLLQLLGQAGANYLEQQLREDMIIGIGWGTSLYEMVNALPSMPLMNCRVVQVIGASGSKGDARIDGPDLAALLASKLSADHQFLHSPLLMDTELAKRTLFAQNQIRDTLNLAARADIVLLGIGTIDVDPKFSSIYRTGFVTEGDIREIKSKGGMANFCGIVLDGDGKILDIDINRRIMAVDLWKLKSNGRKIMGIAGGNRKSRAIEAVLKGGWLDVLCTDTSALQFLIS